MESLGNGMLRLEWAQETWEVHAERALFWPAKSSLIIADPHFGKAAAFRSAGVPVPSGTTHCNLDRLDRVLMRTGAHRLIILGDLLHSRSGRADGTMQIISDWRGRHGQLEIVLVRGNHDRDAGDPPAAWRFECCNGGLGEGQLRFHHEPVPPRRPDEFILGGHVHPCAVLGDAHGSSMRVACFHFSSRIGVLPAFGSFTGMHPVSVRAGDRVFALNGSEVIEVRTAVRQGACS